MAAIKVQGLTKRFGEVLAVDRLDFEIDQGTVAGFLGPNGAGKTTTLRMLLGLVAPTAGSARIDGKPYRELADPVRHVGALLEASSFHPGRSARNHLRVVATAAGLPPTRADETLAEVGLAEVAQTVDQVVIIAAGRLVTQSTLAALTARTDQLVRVRTPQAEALRALLAAQGIQANPDGADQLVAAGTTTEAVGQMAAAAGVVIYEMGAERSNLEDVFLQLTTQQGVHS